MKKLSSFAVLAAVLGLGQHVVGLPVFEPFNYASNSLLIGQTTPGGLTWVAAGAGAEQPTVQPGNLAVPDLVSPTGNRARILAGAGTSARLPFGGVVSVGAVFFSFAMKVADVAGLGTGIDFIAALTSSDMAQANTPTNGFSRIYLRSATSGYQIGLSKSSSVAGDIVWHPTTFTSNDTVLVVGSYTFTVGPGNDTARLWVNPSAAAFGASDAPVATLTATTGPDVNQLASFVLFQKPAPILPALLQIDELRLGATWASVTPQPPNQPPTISAIDDRTISEDPGTGPIAFTVNDGETDAGSLTLSATSTNTALVPLGNIMFGGSGSNRTVTVTPATEQSGTTMIAITVSDGELRASNSFVLTVAAAPRDFGDAPSCYPVTLAENGPWHIYSGATWRLGTRWDQETDGTHSIAADYDDTHGASPDDDDGVVFVSTRGTITVDVTAGADGYLDAWMDFNRDGDWDDADEHIFASEPLTAATTKRLFITVPSYVAMAGQFVSRWRFSEHGGLSYTGAGGKGEVEDYRTDWQPEEDPCARVTQSPLELTILPGQNGQVILRWMSLPGVSCRIEWTANPTSGNWTILKSVPGTGAVVSAADIASASARFYRVAAECKPIRLGSWGQTVKTSNPDLTDAWHDDITNYVKALWETGQNFCIYSVDHDSTNGLPQWEDFKLLLEEVKDTDFQVFAAIGAPHLGDERTRWHQAGFVPCDCEIDTGTWDYAAYYACQSNCLQAWLGAWTNAADTLSQLSLTYPNLVGLVFNDFDGYVESADYPACRFGNRLTHTQVKEIADAAHRHNCKFGFWPTCYYSFARILSDGYILGANYGVNLIPGEEMSVTLEFLLTAPTPFARFSFFHSDSEDRDDFGLSLFKEVFVNNTMFLSNSIAGNQSHEYFTTTNIAAYLSPGTNTIMLKLRAEGWGNSCGNKFWYIWKPVLQLDKGTGLVTVPFTATNFNTVALHSSYTSTVKCEGGYTGTNLISNTDFRIPAGCTLPDDPTSGYAARLLVAAPSGGYSIRDLVDGIVAPYYQTSSPLYDARGFGLLLDAAVSELHGVKLMALQLGRDYTTNPMLDLEGLTEQLHIASSKADYSGLWAMPLGLHYLDAQLGMFAERESNKTAYNFLAYLPPESVVQGWYQRWRSTPALLGTNIQVTIFDEETETNGLTEKLYWDTGAGAPEIIWEADVSTNTMTSLSSFAVTNTLVLMAEIPATWSWDTMVYFKVVNADDPSADLGPASGFWTYETGVNTKSRQTYDVQRSVFLGLRK